MRSVSRRGLALVLLGIATARGAAAGDVDDLTRAPGAARLAADRLGITAAEQKLETRLRPLAWPRRAASRPSPLVPYTGLPSAGAVRVYVRATSTGDEVLGTLRKAGARIELVDRAGGRVQAVMDGPQMRALSGQPWLLGIRAAEPGRLRTGSVTSEGDAASRADVVRAQGYDGTGVVVGVISDGIDHAASAQATGDLPMVTVPAGCSAGSGDEGTALLEIVHDVAPGAELLFASGQTSGVTFIDAVGCLVAAGARVIADDLGFFDEPFFADGPVAVAVRAAVQAGVSYHSAAGNEAQEHLEQPYRDAGNGFHDFGGGDQADDMQIDPGDRLVCVLQWNDPFGASANDYDLGIFDASLNLISASTNLQDGTQDPIEIASWPNDTGIPRTVKVAIQKVSGADRLLDMFCLHGLAQQYVTPAKSIFGQPALPEVVAVGAIDVHDPGLADVEPFSSRGPASILFPASATRPKPDLVAYDGVSITNAGGFPACPPSCTFFGTSAATPHSAAVAALLLDKNPFLTPAAIQNALRAGAVDIGPAGFDDTAGAGRLDAAAAAAAVPVPQCYDGSACDDGDACTLDTCDRGSCTHPPVACDDGNVCNGVETCDPAAGCRPGVALVCRDEDPCTVDDCDPTTGCRFTDLPGVDYVSCALEQHLRPLLPSPTASGSASRAARRLRAALVRAERRVANATAGPAARRRRHLARAGQLVAAMQRIAKRHATELGSTVVQSIVLETTSIERKMRALRKSL